MTVGDEAAMVRLGSEIGATLDGRAVFGLCGDLGAGKTHFVKGVVEGLGSDDAVSSPTFSLVQEYTRGRIGVSHFDFYRIEDAGELLDLGWDDYIDDGGVVVVEWADRFPDLLPDFTRWFRFKVLEGGAREVLEVEAPLAE